MRQGGSSRRAALLAAIDEHVPLRAAIESFWLRPEHRATAAWHEHGDINAVMLATCLLPDGFLDLRVASSGDAASVVY
jgi:hypothetical protein